MLQPKKRKYTTEHKGHMKGKAQRGNELSYGEYGLMATECGRLSSKQIEAARRVLANTTKRAGKIWIKVFPHKPVTKKGEGRMGSGKGSVFQYVSVIKPGLVLFEMSGIPEDVAEEAMRKAGNKLSVLTKVIKKHETE
ncbi:MAG: 50S ribosomal protein L16 [bacterium]